MSWNILTWKVLDHQPSIQVWYLKHLQGLPYFLKQVIFLPLSRSYIFRSRANLRTPKYYGLNNAENFYISTANNGTLGECFIFMDNDIYCLLFETNIVIILVLLKGMWYLWPELSDGNIKHLSSNETLVVYMHGNSLGKILIYVQFYFSDCLVLY